MYVFKTYSRYEIPEIPENTKLIPRVKKSEFIEIQNGPNELRLNWLLKSSLAS
jgi:hypothetical protein